MTYKIPFEGVEVYTRCLAYVLFSWHLLNNLPARDTEYAGFRGTINLHGWAMGS